MAALYALIAPFSTGAGTLGTGGWRLICPDVVGADVGAAEDGDLDQPAVFVDDALEEDVLIVGVVFSGAGHQLALPAGVGPGLVLDEVQAPGKKAMPGKAFLSGYRKWME